MFIESCHLLWNWLFSKMDMYPTVYIDPIHLTPSVRGLVDDLVVTWNCWNTIICHHLYCINKKHMKTSPVEKSFPEIHSWYSVFNVPILFSLLYVASRRKGSTDCDIVDEPTAPVPTILSTLWRKYLVHWGGYGIEDTRSITTLSFRVS